MATTEEQILSILNNSLNPNDVPLNTGLTGTEFNLIINPTLNRLEKVLVTSSGNFITIGGNVFRHEVGYTLGVKNNGVTLAINDIISNGIITNSGYTIEIVRAIYKGGSITDFGVYNPSDNKFTGGSYDIFVCIEL